MAAAKRDPMETEHATVRRALNERAQVFTSEFRNTIVGVADLDARKRVEYIGTATLFQAGGRYFAASAKHVLDLLATRSLALIGHGLVEVTGQYFHSQPLDGKQDPFDLAFVEISPNQASQLVGAKFLEVRDCDLAHEAVLTRPAGSKYYAFGYPCKLQKQLPPGEAFEPEPLVVQVLPASPEKYAALPIYPEHHLLFDFDRKEASSLEGPRTAPKLNGMSGCGIWTAPRSPADSPHGQKLVAILIEYHAGSLKAIVATRVSVLLAGIVKFFPDVIAAA
jgi:hypothetical protein